MKHDNSRACTRLQAFISLARGFLNSENSFKISQFEIYNDLNEKEKKKPLKIFGF